MHYFQVIPLHLTGPGHDWFVTQILTNQLGPEAWLLSLVQFGFASLSFSPM